MKSAEVHIRKAQLRMLRDRIDIVSETQPEILELREKLLEIDGEELVAIPPKLGLDPFVPFLTELGEVMEYPVKLRKMEASQCHDNVERLVKDKKPSVMGRGYGLSDNGLWRNHSWGLKQTRGRLAIVETTVSREIYFGVLLPREALMASGIFSH